MQKEKVIDGVMGDIKASNSVNPISLDKLKDANSLSKIKKDYKELKSQYQKEKSTNETLKLQIQNAHSRFTFKARLTVRKKIFLTGNITKFFPT